MVTHGNLIDNLEYIRKSFGLSQSSVGVHWLPPYHDMGLIGGIFETIYSGARSILMPSICFVQKPVRWLKTISRYRATISGGPNFAYNLCVNKISPEQCSALDLSSWKLAFCGAEQVRAETLERFAQAFTPIGFQPDAFYPCYGMAEASLMISGRSGVKCASPTMPKSNGSEAEHNRFEFVSCGHFSREHIDLCIVSPDSRTLLPEGQVGEIWVSGPGVTTGYWEQEQQTQETYEAFLADTNEGPFLRTGDVGFEYHNELYITGRLRELIIIRGRNYFPQDIELTVERSHSELNSNGGAAFSVETDGEERLIIVQEIRRDRYRNFHEQEIIESICKALSLNFELRAEAVLLLRPNSIPRTANGKIQRHACKAGFLNGTLDVMGEWRRPLEAPKPGSSLEIGSPDREASLSPSDARRRIQNWLIEKLAKELRVSPEVIKPERPFTDYSLDSLQQAGISGELADWLGCRLQPTLLLEYPDISSLSRYLAVLKDVSERLSELVPEERNTLLAQVSEEGTSRRFSDVEAVPERFYRLNLLPQYRDLQKRQRELTKSGFRSPFFTLHAGVNNDRTLIDGKQFINYSSNNYLGLSGHPEVSQAAKDAIDRYGTGVSASRIVSGERPVHLELEREIADLIGTDDCICFVGGNLTNMSVIGHLFGKNDLILYDELSHDSVLQGIALSHADSHAFRHNDWEDLSRLLQDRRIHYEKVLIFIEGIYSMDGDVPDAPKFVEVKRRHKALLMVDECLSIGVLGESGCGIRQHFFLNAEDVDIWMGGISKAFASCGGYVAGSHALVQYLKYSAPGFIYTTGMSPANAAAALAAIRILKREPERVARLHELSRFFLETAREHKLNPGRSKDTPVVPIIIKNEIQCMYAYQMLSERGINVQPILYPAVPANASRLRFFLSCTHSETQIEFTVKVLAQVLDKLGVEENQGTEIVCLDRTDDRICK
jgi:8-amino-7-oxononanoate synthase